MRTTWNWKKFDIFQQKQIFLNPFAMFLLDINCNFLWNTNCKAAFLILKTLIKCVKWESPIELNWANSPPHQCKERKSCTAYDEYATPTFVRLLSTITSIYLNSIKNCTGWWILYAHFCKTFAHYYNLLDLGAREATILIWRGDTKEHLAQWKIYLLH